MINIHIDRSLVFALCQHIQIICVFQNVVLIKIYKKKVFIKHGFGEPNDDISTSNKLLVNFYSLPCSSTPWSCSNRFTACFRFYTFVVISLCIFLAEKDTCSIWFGVKVFTTVCLIYSYKLNTQGLMRTRLWFWKSGNIFFFENV